GVLGAFLSGDQTALLHPGEVMRQATAVPADLGAQLAGSQQAFGRFRQRMVSYRLDGEIAHHDTNGGGGVIAEGDTQWMTAGGGILHDEVPTERALRNGGPSHGVQLWVNLPSSLKFTQPRYQAITGEHLVLLSSDDGGALVRLIAGELAGHPGPGDTHTPITYAHATVSPGAQLTVPW